MRRDEPAITLRLNGGCFGNLDEGALAPEVLRRLRRQLGFWPRGGEWVVVRAGGGSVAGRLEAWGSDRCGPWVCIDGDIFDLGAVQRWTWLWRG